METCNKNPICFTLVVNDITVKYTREQDTEHLICALNKNYGIMIDQTATKYIMIKWEHEN